MGIRERQRRSCGGPTRREMLRAGCLAPLGLGLTGVLQAQSGAVPKGRAKSVILLFMWGGPSHLDTWDPKPDAPAEVRGSFRSIATTVPGLQISEHFPQLATRAKQYAVVRSMTHRSGHLCRASPDDRVGRAKPLRRPTGRVGACRPRAVVRKIALGDACRRDRSVGDLHRRARRHRAGARTPAGWVAVRPFSSRQPGLALVRRGGAACTRRRVFRPSEGPG